VNASPQKRRKLQDHIEEPVELSDAELDHAENEEAMPGFYEHCEEDAEMDIDVGAPDHEDREDREPHETNADDAAVSRTKPRPPISAPARTSFGHMRNAAASTSSGSSIKAKPRSTSDIAQPSDASSSHARIAEPPFEAPLPPQQLEVEATKTGTLECPVCGKLLKTNNQALNSHIDFCLSRGAIMDAQANAKAKSPKKGFKSWEKKNAKSGIVKRKKG
jgi:DNA polymerase kappa